MLWSEPRRCREAPYPSPYPPEFRAEAVRRARGGDKPLPALAADLVARTFAASAPKRWWLGDSTFVPTYEGWRYLAVRLDANARRVVGWTMADRSPRSPSTRWRWPSRLAARGLVCSMSRPGDGLDNASAESIFATLKAARCDRRVWATRAAARTAPCAWIDVPYNRQRAHSALAFQPPAIVEEGVVSEQAASRYAVRGREATSAAHHRGYLPPARSSTGAH